MSARSLVAPLIQELKEACRRPLFTEICLDDSKLDYKNLLLEKADHSEIPNSTRTSLPWEQFSSWHQSANGLVSAEATGPKCRKSWRELVREATQVLPLMTEEEHGEITHYISILLLGFLLPHSTGNEYFLMQNSGNISQSIWTLPLEERMERTCRHYASFELGELDTIMDSDWEMAFDAFVSQGLAPFLGLRSAHLHKVDLFHILAMAVHPQPSPRVIPETHASLQGKHYWEYAQKLFGNRAAHAFHLNYAHRLKLIKMLTHDLVLPAYDPNLPLADCPLLDGAIPHLRASLHTFANMSALSMQDGHWARSALISIATQARQEIVWKEEWEFLIQKMVEDRTTYPDCRHGCAPMLQDQHVWGKVHDTFNNSLFCPHAGRGMLLAEFLTRTCKARHHAPPKFLHEAFSSLTDAVEWQMHCWKQPEEDEEPVDSEEPPCMLASLLFAAKSFFYFLDSKSSTNDVSERQEELVVCAISLCHHFDPTIASQAADVCCVALAYGAKNVVEQAALPLCVSLKVTLTEFFPDGSTAESRLLQSSLQNIISTASRRSPSFAVSILNLLLKQVDKSIESKDTSIKTATDADGDVTMTGNSAEEPKAECKIGFLLRLIASTSTANPTAVGEKVSKIAELLPKVEDNVVWKSQIIATLLAYRQAHFFLTEKRDKTNIIALISKPLDHWSFYRMAAYALHTGNFAVASQAYQQILKQSLSERYYMWILSLSKIAESEGDLAKLAARGIPSATTTLRSALSILSSLHVLDKANDHDFTFQIHMVRLRLDFLDLLTSLRQMIREIRLTGGCPGKRTRSFLHFQNIVRCLDALAKRYCGIYKKNGLFSCQQTRTSLRALYSLCHFLGHSIRVVFQDAFQSGKKEIKRPEDEPRGDMALPLARFMQRIDSGVVDKMSPAVDPVIRAVAMLEVVDGILLCPVPFPKRFLSVSTIPQSVLQLWVDPEQTNENSGANIIECYPGVSFDFFASGEIVAPLVAKAQLPFTSIMLWHRATYARPLQEDTYEKQDDEHMEGEKQDEEAAAVPKKNPTLWDYTPVSTTLLPNGTFTCKVECPPIREEGNYLVEVKLGCLDIRGGEWEIPILGHKDVGTLEVQVTRSGWHA